MPFCAGCELWFGVISFPARVKSEAPTMMHRDSPWSCNCKDNHAWTKTPAATRTAARTTVLPPGFVGVRGFRGVLGFTFAKLIVDRPLQMPTKAVESRLINLHSAGYPWIDFCRTHNTPLYAQDSASTRQQRLSSFCKSSPPAAPALLDFSLAQRRPAPAAKQLLAVP